MELEDFFAASSGLSADGQIAIIVVFPLIGIVINRAWLVRQRRLQIAEGEKSKIPPVVGSEHVAIGNWLSIAVVVVALLGMAYPIFSKFLKDNIFLQNPLRAFLVVTLFLGTITSFTFLLKAKNKIWRNVFAVSTSAGLIILGAQPEVFRRDNEWFFSHYYYGVTAALLMIISVAITQDIYKDRQNRWRNIHIILNCFALLLFMGQGMTGTRDLLSIPFSWQKDYLRQCDSKTRTCPKSTAFYSYRD